MDSCNLLKAMFYKSEKKVNCIFLSFWLLTLKKSLPLTFSSHQPTISHKLPLILKTLFSQPPQPKKVHVLSMTHTTCAFDSLINWSCWPSLLSFVFIACIVIKIVQAENKSFCLLSQLHNGSIVTRNRSHKIAHLGSNCTSIKLIFWR